METVYAELMKLGCWNHFEGVAFDKLSESRKKSFNKFLSCTKKNLTNNTVEFSDPLILLLYFCNCEEESFSG